MWAYSIIYYLDVPITIFRHPQGFERPEICDDMYQAWGSRYEPVSFYQTAQTEGNIFT